MTRAMQNIQVIFKSEISQNAFISLCSLEFGLTLETLSILLGISEHEAYTRVIDRNPKYFESMKFQLGYSAENQEEAKQNFLRYFYLLCLAYSKKDIEEYKRLLRKINDADIENLLANKKDEYTDDEIIRIVKYQVKYKLSNKQISELFGIADSNYRKRSSRLLEKYPKLKTQYQTLADIFTNNFNDKRGRNG